MSRTIQDVLKENQAQFIKEVTPIVPTVAEFMPNFPDDELLDALDMALFIFPDDRTEYNLKQLLELKGCEVTPEQMLGLIPVIDAYVTKLRKVKTFIEST
jgi:hypothetical protein